MFRRYGYEDIETPGFEYFEVFSREVGTIPSKDLYKFFDREGNTLVLRPDFTPSVARACATYFSPEKEVVSLCYTGNTFINNSSYQGRLKESTQMGVERMGDDSAEADAELLAMTVECLLASGLTDFQVSVGQVDYFRSLLEQARMSPEDEEQLRSLVSMKNYFGVEELVERLGIDQKVGNALAQLPRMFGSSDVLEKAKALTQEPKALQAVARLEEIYQILKIYGYEKYISFDFAMVSKYHYYTGIIFRGYTFGTGDAIVKGGRYDHLIEKFGKQSPSIGFAIVLDELMNALTRQKIRIVYTRKNTMIVYDEGKQREAIALAKDFRRKAKNAELIKKDKGKLLEDYVAYGKEYYAGNLIYIKKSGEITMINLVTGEHKIVNSTDRS